VNPDPNPEAGFGNKKFKKFTVEFFLNSCKKMQLLFLGLHEGLSSFWRSL
jgi:hypothetical protein